MLSTQASPRGRGYRNVAVVPVTKTEVDDCARILADYGDGKEWGGAQPSEIAYLRESVARGHSALPRRVLTLLLWSNKGVRLAAFVDARRREKLGQSRAKDIPALILKETEDESAANVMESRVLAGQADAAEKLRLADKSREQARDLLDLADALHDDVHGARA